MRTVKEISAEMEAVRQWPQKDTQCHRTCKLINLARELYEAFKANLK